MKILIVEDEESIREVEAAYLKNAGFDVVECGNGTEAYEIVKKTNFDLIVLDLNLPGIDGISLCKMIRKFSNVPIIMVTAKIDESDELLGLEIGADDYVKKPFSPRILLGRIKVLVRKSQGKTLKFGYLQIDPEKMTVFVKEELRKLTTTQFNILYALAGSPGKVFTRDEILDKAYLDSVGSEIFDRTIDVHIRNIRKQIDSHDSTSFIQTVIGKGYKFNEKV